MNDLVLSLFPGIGLLDMAFEEEGFCIVRGPDLLWGGDVKRFHPPAGKFDGIIGGPPCQRASKFSQFAARAGRPMAEDLIPEFQRCVNEAQPDWFLMENVPESMIPICSCYGTFSFILNNRWLGGEQNRKRKFTFGERRRPAWDLRALIEPAALEAFEWSPTVMAGGGVKPGTEHRRGKRNGNEYGYHSQKILAEALRLQGVPEDFLDGTPLTLEGKHRVIGNGVPLPMGRTIAKAVRGALLKDALMCGLFGETCRKSQGEGRQSRAYTAATTSEEAEPQSENA